VPPVAVVDAPHWFGELAVLTAPSRFVTIAAVSDAETWVLSRDRFEAWIARHPVIYRNLLASLSRQIQTKDRDLVEQASLAIERARLLGDLQQRNAELAALTKSTRAISEPLDLDTSLDAISTMPPRSPGPRRPASSCTIRPATPSACGRRTTRPSDTSGRWGTAPCRRTA